jgi:hypothetical protein
VPGVVKLRAPLLAKGEPVIAVEFPVVGSYQEAFMAFENIFMFTLSGVVVAATGVYTTAADARVGTALSGTQAAVA